MKKYLLFIGIQCFSFAPFAQMTTEYETGQGTTDAWTGWTSQTTGVTAENTNGVNHYIFTLTGPLGSNFNIEITRNFNIIHTPINVYYSVFAQSATLELLYSTDNVNWTSIDSDVFGTTYSSGAYVKAVSPAVSSYYLKLKISGTVGDQQQVNFSNFRIDAEQSIAIGLDETKQAYAIQMQVNTLILSGYNSDYQLKVYSLGGEEVFSAVNGYSHDLSGLHKGVYLVSLRTAENEVLTQKIFIH